MTTKQNKENKTKLGGLSIFLLILSGLSFIFAFYAPYFYTEKCAFSTTGQIGDTIGGLMNPYIAISGVLITFLAFYIQFKANRLQYDSFREELDEQKTQYKRTQLENQFYEMLKLHKENINELEIALIRVINSNHLDGEKSERIIKGRQVFDFLVKELELCYYLSKAELPNSKTEEIFSRAYKIFFHGILVEKKDESELYETFEEVKNLHANNSYSYLHRLEIEKLDMEWNYDLNYPIFEGYASQLAYYYRHLFMTVKFITSIEESLISYEDKRKYLRILRAQLSNNEQAMLFYNWYAEYGSQWENDKNKFFTDYRMIHNLHQELLLSDIKLLDIFGDKVKYRKEKNRKKDPLFEFQD